MPPMRSFLGITSPMPVFFIFIVCISYSLLFFQCFLVVLRSFLRRSFGVPSEYLLSLLGTRPLSARYLSATCSVQNRTNTAQVMHMYRTKTMANRCLLLGYSLFGSCPLALDSVAWLVQELVRLPKQEWPHVSVANIRKNSHIICTSGNLLESFMR